jgi:hypothetical protein
MDLREKISREIQALPLKDQKKVLQEFDDLKDYLRKGAMGDAWGCADRILQILQRHNKPLSNFIKYLAICFAG